MKYSLLIAGILLAAATAGTPQPVRAAAFDGEWSVVIITEKGICDRGYRYPLRVIKGTVTYAGDLGINVSGKVTPRGAVKVSLSKGGQSAAGSGRLSAKSGAGT